MLLAIEEQGYVISFQFLFNRRYATRIVHDFNYNYHDHYDNNHNNYYQTAGNFHRDNCYDTGENNNNYYHRQLVGSTW